MCIVFVANDNISYVYCYYNVCLNITDPQIIIPLVWPQGTYGFPQSSAGCPNNNFGHGCIYQDTEDKNNKNRFKNVHLLKKGKFSNNIQVCYCVKQYNTQSGGSWPKGRYCINKKGRCPQGFRIGSIYWDDEDSNNKNSASGYIPDSIVNRNTKMFYCCRDDASINEPVYLPITKPFVLYQYFSRGCQKVRKMRAVEVTIRFDDEDSGNKDSCNGARPYDTGCNGNHKLYMCHYTPI